MTNQPDDLAPHEVAKQRPCLRCKEPFASAWSGEQICPHCKRSQAWRDGASLMSSSAGTRS